MTSQPSSLLKLQQYTAKVKEIHYDVDTTSGGEDYEARITRTLQSLQNQVKQQQATLDKLRAQNSISIDEPSQDPVTRLRQLRTITAAYKSLSIAEPLLPLPSSPLPALLALRSTLNLVDQTKTSINEIKESVDKARIRFQQEETDLRDARSIKQALERRIEKLSRKNEEQSQSTSEVVAKSMIQEQQQKKRYYLTEIRKLIKAFNKFVDERLAAMVAAEDLGGPVVGELLDIDDETLASGFNQKGRPKKAKTLSITSKAKRKQRNDDIWGSEGEDIEESTGREKEAAGAQFRTLTEDLLNAAANDEVSNRYIKITRESAAVRFLVRAKVAQFHPDDARRLRLIDFGKELDDFNWTSN